MQKNIRRLSLLGFCYPAACAFCFFTAPLVAVHAGPSGVEQAKGIPAEDRLISASLKTLAKVFVATRERGSLASALERMDEEAFRRKYAKAYAIIGKCGSLASAYGLSDALTKQELARKLLSWDTRTLCALIDAVPDDILAVEFKRYVARQGGRRTGEDPSAHTSRIWNQLLENSGFK